MSFSLPSRRRPIFTGSRLGKMKLNLTIFKLHSQGLFFCNAAALLHCCLVLFRWDLRWLKQRRHPASISPTNSCAEHFFLSFCMVAFFNSSFYSNYKACFHRAVVPVLLQAITNANQTISRRNNGFFKAKMKLIIQRI
jgi:hypothetical protein